MIYDLWDRLTFTLEDLRDRSALALEEVWLWLIDRFEELRSTRFGLPIAGAVLAVVVVGLALIIARGSDNAETASAPLAPVEPPSAIADSQFMQERGFSIALPDAWHRIKPPQGASFAARSNDDLGEATLWVDRDPNLSFGDFIHQSLTGLEQLGDNAQVTNRVEGASIETSIAELEAEVPVDGGLAGPYRVTLRAAGPYRYYLATSIGAGAPPRLLADAELLSATFRPTVEVKDGKSN